jgi:hypothetical protein
MCLCNFGSLGQESGLPDAWLAGQQEYARTGAVDVQLDGFAFMNTPNEREGCRRFSLIGVRGCDGRGQTAGRVFKEPSIGTG